MDGTLFISPFNWKRIKEKLGVKGELILDHLYSLPPEEKRGKFILLEKMEREAVSKGKPAPEAERILSLLKERGLKLGETAGLEPRWWFLTGLTWVTGAW